VIPDFGTHKCIPIEMLGISDEVQVWMLGEGGFEIGKIDNDAFAPYAVDIGSVNHEVRILLEIVVES
jgi:hypothetical protein